MRNSVPRISAALAICSLFLIAPRPAAAQGTTIYVDPGIGATSCGGYDPVRRICLGGTSTAFLTIAGAGTAAKPGWTVLIRAGNYRERLSPFGSGTQTQPIIFRRYGNEAPTITGISPGILLVKKEYIEIDGITVTDVSGWARLEDSRNITIRNSIFRRATATGTTGGVKLVRSSNNRIVSNTFDDGNDNMILVDSADRNLIQDNIFQEARHSLLSVRCSNFNVFRGNSFSNTKQKAIEIYDCEGTSTDTPYRLDATKHNLFELNSVTKTLASDLDHRYNGIQHGGQQTIVRRNVFRNNDGGGVYYQMYADENLYVYGNRMYSNTFYANRCHAIIGSSGTATFRDQIVKNNLLYKNVTCSGGPQQTRISDPNVVVLINNAIETLPPGFANEAANDFRLTAGSRMIDAGVAFTSTAAAGSGISLRVQDASYFYDGYGIPGELGDTIQFVGRPDAAIVIAIDYATNTLTLDRALAWSAGTGVSLRYSGARPDMGAFEFVTPDPGGGGAAATFVRTDSTTQGTWRGVYGTQGWALAADATSLPAYAQLTLGGESMWTWRVSTTDVRALQRPTASDRFAATWYSSGSFTFDLNLTDASPHQVALYGVDWDSGSRRSTRTERIEVLDGASGALLDMRTLANFPNGQYLVWTIQGHVIFRVTLVASVNAVISGLFIDPSQ
jgi:parallel beta-helix repeat protein